MSSRKKSGGTDKFISASNECDDAKMESRIENNCEDENNIMMKGNIGIQHRMGEIICKFRNDQCYERFSTCSSLIDDSDIFYGPSLINVNNKKDLKSNKGENSRHKRSTIVIKELASTVIRKIFFAPKSRLCVPNPTAKNSNAATDLLEQVPEDDDGQQLVLVSPYDHILTDDDENDGKQPALASPNDCRLYQSNTENANSTEGNIVNMNEGNYSPSSMNVERGITRMDGHFGGCRLSNNLADLHSMKDGSMFCSNRAIAGTPQKKRDMNFFKLFSEKTGFAEWHSFSKRRDSPSSMEEMFSCFYSNLDPSSKSKLSSSSTSKPLLGNMHTDIDSDGQEHESQLYTSAVSTTPQFQQLSNSLQSRIEPEMYEKEHDFFLLASDNSSDDESIEKILKPKGRSRKEKSLGLHCMEDDDNSLKDPDESLITTPSTKTSPRRRKLSTFCSTDKSKGGLGQSRVQNMIVSEEAEFSKALHSFHERKNYEDAKIKFQLTLRKRIMIYGVLSFEVATVHEYIGDCIYCQEQQGGILGENSNVNGHHENMASFGIHSCQEILFHYLAALRAVGVENWGDLSIGNYKDNHKNSIKKLRKEISFHDDKLVPKKINFENPTDSIDPCRIEPEEKSNMTDEEKLIERVDKRLTGLLIVLHHHFEALDQQLPTNKSFTSRSSSSSDESQLLGPPSMRRVNTI